METNKFEIFNKLSSEEIIFDVETTGLKKDHDNIIEFAAEDLKTDAKISFRIRREKRPSRLLEHLLLLGNHLRIRKTPYLNMMRQVKYAKFFEKMSVIYGHNVTFIVYSTKPIYEWSFAYQLSCNNRIVIDTLHLFSMASHFTDKFVIP